MRLLLATMVSVTALVVAGCSDGGSLLPERAPAAVNYTTFVKAQLAADADNKDPIAINGINFIFTDLNNPDAYDDVLAADN